MSSIWQRVRHQFPVTENLIYLNHAAVTPLPKFTADAMAALAADACQWGSFHYDEWLQAYEDVRVSAAKLIGAHRDEIAFVKNTSEGIATVALGLDWRPGDRIVAFREEFPANYYIWDRVPGAQVTWLSVHDPLDAIDAACEGARLLAISYVNYLSGFTVDLNAIGEICRRRGVFFLVDAIQGLGALPLHVDAAHIDALAADGHKWLLGPEGCGILYVRRDRLDSIAPVEFGWTNVRHYADYASRDTTLRSDAGRYEPGTLNTIGLYGLRASLDFIKQIGLDEITPAVRALAARIESGVRAKGCEVLPTGSGIVTFRKPGADSRLIVSALRNERILTAPRQGWIRTSPHFYIAPDEIDRMLDVIP
ncbi:MAG: aminotransferase class V-fold PLP-dependent enzyme [Bryobacteraceae bacterium]